VTGGRAGLAGNAPSMDQIVTHSTVGSYLRAFEASAETSGGPPWLRELRRRAAEQLAAAGFPTMRDENWHFTNLSPVVEKPFTPVASPDAVSEAQLTQFLLQSSWHTLVFVNGSLDEKLSSRGGQPKGVVIERLSAALDSRSGPLETQFGKLAAPEKAAFNALNTMFASDGVVISIAPDVVVQQPIHLLFVSTGASAAGLISPRTLILAKHHSSATVIESYVSLADSAHLTNALTEIYLEDGARLDHYKIQRESTEAYHVGTIEVMQNRDSTFNSFSFASGGALSRTNIYTRLDGRGSSVLLNGLYFAGGTQHVDHQTRIEHVAPDCRSWEVYKGILDGSAHGVFNGKVYVHPEAQKTDGKQSNNNLLLSPNARVDTKPQLEIFADDVKCTHGATIGRLDAAALFYCRSRGITEDEARVLLTYAFAAGVLEEISLEPVRKELESIVMRQVGANVDL
jgi:Fe-S cluster assembly protein SufD